LPPGTGNISASPKFVGINDYHLSSLSPCINAGFNSAIVVSYDLEGNPRISGGVVDIGAYESLLNSAGALSALDLLLLGK